jgi:molybdenum cofactor cytidylyltransferase
MKLTKALRCSEPASLAFVGAGGKTTAIFRAARELLAANSNAADSAILVTTSTHFGTWQAKQADRVWAINSAKDIDTLEEQLPKGIVLLFGEELNDRLTGLTPILMEGVNRLAKKHNLPLLIEADGAHTRPLKAPAEHEPAIPEFVQLVVILAGLSGLGKPLSEEWVHRADVFGEITGILPGEIINGGALIKMLLSEEGGLKNIPPQAGRIVLLNQADTPDLKSIAKTIGEAMLPVYQASLIASLARIDDRIPANAEHIAEEESGIYAVIEQTGGVILAAGSSSRFGEPKQLLHWKGETLIRHVVGSASKAGLSPVVVVVGSSAEEVNSAIKDLPVRIVNNSDWMRGMSTSIKAGLAALKGETGGVVFLQADQPQIPPSLIRCLIASHQASLNPIIAPLIDGQRGNPVLFDEATYQDLLAIDGDMGGRALFSRYPVEWVTWHDPKLLMDIDSPEDYQTFLRTYPESEAK